MSMLAHTFLAITAHKAKRGHQPTKALNRLNDQPNPPPEPTPPPARTPLVALTLAEIRKLLTINRHDHHAVNHGLRWSHFRRQHQAQARRAHVRRHLRLQTLMI
jgi:hypothetical protein